LRTGTEKRKEKGGGSRKPRRKAMPRGCRFKNHRIFERKKKKGGREPFHLRTEKKKRKLDCSLLKPPGPLFSYNEKKKKRGEKFVPLNAPRRRKGADRNFLTVLRTASWGGLGPWRFYFI